MTAPYVSLADAPAASDGNANQTHVPLPLRLEPASAFAVLRDALNAADFHERPVARRLGGHTLSGVIRIAEGRTTLTGDVADANALLIRLFIDGDAFPRTLVRSLLGEAAHTACEELGLLSGEADDASLLRATVMLCPLRGVWLASDRIPLPGEPLAHADYVFSGSNELTAQFLDAIPAARGAKVAELCAGTGVAALIAVQRGAESAVAADIAPRCVHFARFNALLNDMADRVRVIQSDGWSGFESGETFDLVVAHPPYVPALSHQYDFRDGGGDGESVTSVILTGLPTRVRRGGRAILRTAFSDRRDGTIAARIRRCLGDASDEFDLVELEALEYGTMDAYKTVTKGGRDFIDCERWLNHFHALGIERFAVCLLELRRNALPEAPVTERRVLKTTMTPDIADWHFRWARLQASSGATADERLAAATPRVAPGVRLAVHLASDADGSWRNIGAMVETDWPTRAVVKSPPLVPTLLELCDGTRNLDALHEGLRDAGLLDNDVGRADVALLVEVLAAAGAVEIPACPLPRRPEPPM